MKRQPDYFEWMTVRHLVQQTKRVMFGHNAVYAPPTRRWTFRSWYVFRTHEHYFNVGRPR